MRHLQPYAALLVIAALTVACSSPGASSGGQNSQAAGASQGGQPSQAAASSGGGGGGGGGTGEFGSLTYEITGDVSKSGELAFTYINGGISLFVDTGWVAYFYSEDQQTVVQINSQSGTNIVNFGDGDIIVIGNSDIGCTFDYSKNDASGLKGTIDCPTPITTNAAGAQINVKFHATVDAHT